MPDKAAPAPAGAARGDAPPDERGKVAAGGDADAQAKGGDGAGDESKKRERDPAHEPEGGVDAKKGGGAGPETKKPKVDSENVSDDVLRKRVEEIISSSNKDELTVKKVRNMLESEFNVSLKDRKSWLKSVVDEILASGSGDEQEGDEEEGEEEEGEGDEDAEGDEDDGAKERRRSTHQSRWANRFGSILSAEMQEFLGVESMNRKLVVKKIWEYIKKHNLQDPKDRRKIILDEKLSKIFKGTAAGRLNMFHMSKQLSRHCFTEDVC